MPTCEHFLLDHGRDLHQDCASHSHQDVQAYGPNLQWFRVLEITPKHLILLVVSSPRYVHTSSWSSPHVLTLRLEHSACSHGTSLCNTLFNTYLASVVVTRVGVAACVAAQLDSCARLPLQCQHLCTCERGGATMRNRTSPIDLPLNQYSAQTLPVRPRLRCGHCPL